MNRLNFYGYIFLNQFYLLLLLNILNDELKETPEHVVEFVQKKT